MTRDHLLGLAAHADTDDIGRRVSAIGKQRALGREAARAIEAAFPPKPKPDPAIAAFERGDHTPEHMKWQFSRPPQTVPDWVALYMMEVPTFNQYTFMRWAEDYCKRCAILRQEPMCELVGQLACDAGASSIGVGLVTAHVQRHHARKT